jgi:archaellum biogenesis ATPase FlaH
MNDSARQYARYVEQQGVTAAVEADHPTNGAVHSEPTEKPIRCLADIPDIMTMDIPPMEYLVVGLIARGTITLWTGSDGTAKTYLAQKMSVAVASGSKFLGRRCHATPVLYLDYENPSFAVRERLDVMAGEPVPDLKIWGTWLEQQPPQIGNELLLSIAKETKPLIIIDPFRYAHGAEENDSTEMMAVMQMLRYCAAVGGAVVILHHPAKTEGSTGRGSTVIKGAADVAFLQELSDEGGLITLKCTKNRFGPKVSVVIRPNYDEGTFDVVDSPEFTRRESETEKLQDIITATPGLSQNAWWKKSGMMKARFVSLVKSNIGILWTEEKSRSSLRYLPTCSQTKNNSENNRTGQGVPSCSVVLTSLGENNRTARPRPGELFSDEGGEPRTGGKETLGKNVEHQPKILVGEVDL